VKRDRWDIILRYGWRKIVSKRTELNDTRRFWSSQWEASHQAVKNEWGKRVRVITTHHASSLMARLLEN
jgi:hypothetical protein